MRTLRLGGLFLAGSMLLATGCASGEKSPAEIAAQNAQDYMARSEAAATRASEAADRAEAAAEKAEAIFRKHMRK